ncbi:chorismate mutase [Actinoplanes sp. NPDC051346]|uniref:chorismate mutase n=1 Tax=Actinoplanes sp. NPDC051346 TaxID=3155048 RepID=UPI00341651DE
MMLRAIRGAIQVDHDQPELVHEAARQLVGAVLEWNRLTPSHLISLLFTVTPDLRSAFPAAAIRTMGLTNVPMICATEIAVPEALPRVIRVMAHVETTRDRSEIRHPYLRGAALLRPDLALSAEPG